MRAWRFLIAAVLLLGGRLSAEAFEWGINGHPVTQVGYIDVPLAAQLDLVVELGATWLRWDCPAGTFQGDTARCDELVAEAGKRKIKLLPVLFSKPGPYDAAATPQQIRAAAAAFARAIVERYKGRITHWELGNELDAYAMIRKGETTRSGKTWIWDGAPDGSSGDDYEEQRYRRARAEIEGLAEGVRQADPEAIRVVDTAGWLHYGFIDRLALEDKVPFEVLAWHWYSEMGDITRVRGKVNLIERLKQYGKPLSINEINRRDGSMGGKETEQAEYVAQVARQMRQAPGITGLFIYELLDQPYHGATNPESHYGLVEIAKNEKGKWQVTRRKEAFAAFKAVIAADRGGR